jgi:hypothetical protein
MVKPLSQYIQQEIGLNQKHHTLSKKERNFMTPIQPRNTTYIKEDQINQGIVISPSEPNNPPSVMGIHMLSMGEFNTEKGTPFTNQKTIQELLTETNNGLQGRMNDYDFNQVKEYIQVGEFGLAYDLLNFIYSHEITKDTSLENILIEIKKTLSS